MSESESGSDGIRAMLRDLFFGGVGGSAASGIGSSIGGAVTPRMMEKLLTEWYESTLKAKLVLDGTTYQSLRARNNGNVHGPFFQALARAYKREQSGAKGIVYIAYARPGQGKTHAAAYLLDHYASKKGQRRGFMFRGGKNRQLAYDLELCQALGVPESCRFNFDWIEKLVMALSGEEHETFSNTAWSSGESVLDSVTGLFCGANTVESATHGTKKLPKNEIGHYPPPLILDDWNTATEEEMKFLKELCQQAFRKRVMVVVLTDNKAIAQKMCQQNGLVRIQPLIGSYSNVALKLGEQITWHSLDWNKKQLTELVALEYDFTGVFPSPFDADGNLDFLDVAMTPAEALHEAEAVMALTLPSNPSSTSAP